MKLKFDSNLEYQLEAIKSTTDLFEGLPHQDDFKIEFNRTKDQLINDLGIGNNHTLPDEQILKNLHSTQIKNNIPKSQSLIEQDSIYSFPNFSIEMETGTGKTYVYLRTIFELNKIYGFKKFIIVVPSIAIREGVISSLKMMREHFKKLYDNIPYDDFVYSSKDLNKVRQFARNNEIQIMIINIQAFQKDANIFHQQQDKLSGRTPAEYVQTTRPIVIIDEPQSVDSTPKSQKAINDLNPLFVLRYSATHINPYNLLYHLDPIKAYDMRIVKQLEVIDSNNTRDFNKTLISLDAVGYWPKNSKSPQAKVTIFENSKNGPREKQIRIKHGIDLAQQTQRSDYEGYLVVNINAELGNEYIEFQNGIILKLEQETDGIRDDRMKSQLRQVIKEHFDKEKKFKEKGIKVLSLFFIDHVKSYRGYDENGNPQKGKLALWFEEIYNEFSNMPTYKNVIPHVAGEVHGGYFSSDKKKGKIIEELDTSGKTSKDEETYELIMKDKERLLNIDEPLRFIFSHSALKEGWDNPNVFQICSLREMGTIRERRQTIGRGLRLPVNQQGERIYDEQINKLTIIADESFESFAKELQKDIEEAIDPSGKFKFGRLSEMAFTQLLNSTGTNYLSQEESKELWNHCQKQGFIDKEGDFTENFKPDHFGFSLNLPDNFINMDEAIINRIKKFLPREFVKDARNRQKIRYNKRIELNPDFKILWDKISQKTQYSIEFRTEDLINLVIKKIKEIPEIKQTQIEISKRDLKITESGIEGDKITSNQIYLIDNKQPLPDILKFLQRETELTRGTLTKILQKSGRLKEFAINPAIFMTEITKKIKEALNELIIDGIKYEPLAGHFYEMRLFEEEEIEAYLDKIYSISSRDNRTPYDYIAYDSSIEKDFAEKLDNDEKIKFFCKLPRWFKINTPIGDYNPDWAIVTQNNEKKLYLVRETKSTDDSNQRRYKENKKLECGKAHFKALDINFKTATSVYDILQE